MGRPKGHAWEWDGNYFPDLASRARRGSPDPAVCLNEGLRPQIRLGDLATARGGSVRRCAGPRATHRRAEPASTARDPERRNPLAHSKCLCTIL
jgi:hypothetical protein